MKSVCAAQAIDSARTGEIACGGSGAELLIFLLGGVLGTGFGVALGFFLFPFVFPPPPATEQLTDADRAAPVATGTFIHANPSDPIHWGRGKVGVYERAVFLEPDFEVGPGPKYHVYLVPNAKVRARDSTSKGIEVRRSRPAACLQGQPALCRSRRASTSKNYPSVVIWCEQFGVLISPADLAAR